MFVLAFLNYRFFNFADLGKGIGVISYHLFRDTCII